MAVVRLSVNLSEDVAKVLRELAESQGITVTEAIRRAIGTEKFIADAKERGGKILIEEPAGTVRHVLFR